MTSLSAILFFVCLLVKYPTPPKKGRLKQAKKIPPSVSTTSKTSMESGGGKSVTSPITLQKTALVPATPLSGNPPQSHHMTPTSKGEERHQRKRKNWRVLAQAVRNQRLIQAVPQLEETLVRPSFPWRKAVSFFQMNYSVDLTAIVVSCG